MKKITNIISSLVVLMLLSCSGNNNDSTKTTPFTETKIDLATHKISTYSIINNTKYLIVFESGLGNDHTVWNEKK